MLLIVAQVFAAEVTKKDAITTSYTAETAGNYTTALEPMKTLEAADLNDPFYKLRLGWLYYNLGKYNDAATYYQKSIKLLPSQDGYEGLANCYLALGLWNETITTCDTVLKSDPAQWIFMLKAGYAQYQKKQYKSAIDYYQRAIKVQPFNFEARGYLIAANYYDNNLVEAKKHWVTRKKYYPASVFVTDFAKAFN
jgi:tetratricopeptide (TPR) repeat protein